MKKLLFVFLFLCSFLYAQNIDREKLNREIKNEIKDSYACSVEVYLKGSQVFNAHYGHADKEGRIAIDSSHLFNVASISKTITALGIMQLYEKGKLDFEDQLVKYFENIPADKAEISLRQLLTHTSGFKQSYAADRVTDREKALEKLLSLPLAYQPGESWSYSNVNYQLLAMIVELVSQESYETFIRKNIFEKAGMSQSRFWGEFEEGEYAKVASTLERLSKKTLRRNWGYIGSNGIYSTASDLSKLMLAYLKFELLSESSSQYMLNQKVKIREGLETAFAWFISTHDGGEEEIWTRGSESWGHNAVVSFFPKEDLMIVVCSNSGEEISANRKIRELVWTEFKGKD